jgi:hypothetical protein
VPVRAVPRAAACCAATGSAAWEAVDPRAIRAVDARRCLLRGGRALPPRGGAVRFTYAWMTPQDFPLLSSRPHC